MVDINLSHSEQILPFCTNTLLVVQETLKILFVMTAGFSVASFWKKSSGEYGGFEICVSCLSVT
jgi:hypothetical protein